MSEVIASIVAPCFNGSAYLERCIENVVSQGVDSEIIVVDDGSSDDSLEQLGRIVTIHAGRVIAARQSNQGPAAARNLGMRMARGKYLCFLDVDDELAPGALAAGIAALERDSSAIAAQGRVELINTHRPIQDWQLESTEATIPGNIVVRSDIARRLGGFPVDPAFRGKAAGEDGCFRLQLAQYGKILKLDLPFLRYSVAPGSHTDYFLDRSIWRDGRIAFTEQSPEEKDGTLFAAFDRYANEVAERLINGAMATLREEINAVVDRHRLAAQFGQVEGTIDALEGFALYAFAKRWPTSGRVVMAGDNLDARAACWLAAAGNAASSAPIYASTSVMAEFLRPILQRAGVGGVEVLPTTSDATIRVLYFGRDVSSHINTNFPEWSRRLVRHGLLILHGYEQGDAISRLFETLRNDPRNWTSLLVLQHLALLESV